MPVELDDIITMRSCVIAVLETLPLEVELRMFGEDRPMPTDRPYGEFWLIGGDGLVLDEKVPRPIVRRVGLLQLTVWQPQASRLGTAKRLITIFNRGFSGKCMCDLLHRSYHFKKKTETWTLSRSAYVATVGRIAFARDEDAEGAADLHLTW